MTNNEIQQLVQSAFTAGVQKALIETGVIKAYITQAEAYRRYGRRNVDDWQSRGLVKYGTKGRYRMYPVETLDRLATTIMAAKAFYEN